MSKVCTSNEHHKSGGRPTESSISEMAPRRGDLDAIATLPQPASEFKSCIGEDVAMVDELSLSDDDEPALPASNSHNPFGEILPDPNSSRIVFGHNFTGVIRHYGHGHQSGGSHTHGYGHNQSGGGYGQAPAPADGGKEYVWTCCRCGAQNDYKLHASCSYCFNHWRESCCVIAEVTRI